jgi:hypothetical protein
MAMRNRRAARLFAVAAVLAPMLVAQTAFSQQDGPPTEKKNSASPRVKTHVGKRDIAFFEKTKNAKGNEKVRVAIWLTDIERDEINSRTGGQAAGREGSEQAEAAQHARSRAYAESYRTHSQRVVDRIGRGGGKVTTVSRLAPLVIAEVHARQLSDLESLPEVDTIYEENVVGGHELDIETSVHQADNAWAVNNVGLQARACVVEDDGITAGNPHIAFGEYFNPGTPNVGRHANFVAGVIQGTANTDEAGADVRGHAWGGLPILSGNSGSYSDAALVNATEWCVLDNFPRAHVVNHSYFTNTTRSFTGLDRYLDHVQRVHAVLQVKSAGNRGTQEGNVTSPGKGWNTLTVGSVDDKSTVSAADDLMSNFSSFVDPFRPGSTSSVVSKPEVAAIGCRDSVPSTHVGFKSNIEASPWTGFHGCGTSYSAPAVAGTAMLIYQANAALKGWPEPTKAIIMTTAIGNVEGSRTFSDKDGAGRISSNSARVLAANTSTTSPTQRVKFGSFNPSTYPTTATTEFSMSRTTGQRIRCTVVWDSAAGTHAAGATPTTDNLLVDMDLRITRASTNTIVASSSSVNNAFEIVDVNAPGADTYHVQLNRFGTSTETSNFYGLACLP